MMSTSAQARETEEPVYKVVKTTPDYEVRAYESYLIASVVIEGKYKEITGHGFRLIADYIFGNNQRQTKIKMTTPVVHESLPKMKVADSIGSYTIYFVMPAQYSIDTISLPNNTMIKLTNMPARKVAVAKFSGSFSHTKALAIHQKLKQQLQSNGYHHTEKLIFARYNPPWTPPSMNRHEVWIELVD